MSGTTPEPGNALKGGGWSVTIKVDWQLLNYIGGMVAADGLHCSVQPGSAILLLTSGFTLKPGNGQDVGGRELGNK